MTQTTTPTYYSRRLVYYVQELWRRREFIWFLAMGNFKARNASTALGLFWWVLNPILLSLVYWFVFGFIFPGAKQDYFRPSEQLLSWGVDRLVRLTRHLPVTSVPLAESASWTRTGPAMTNVLRGGR